MRLIYINFVGTNFLGVNIYEFLFTYGDLKDVTGEDWDSYPANGNPKPPVECIDAAYKVETDISLELIQDHEAFDMDDCRQGLIAMAWEDDKDWDSGMFDTRLFFRFGDNKETVNNKLYTRDIYLEKIYENEAKELN